MYLNLPAARCAYLHMEPLGAVRARSYVRWQARIHSYRRLAWKQQPMRRQARLSELVVHSWIPRCSSDSLMHRIRGCVLVR